MPQLMIDSATDSVEALRITAAYLNQLADLKLRDVVVEAEEQIINIGDAAHGFAAHAWRGDTAKDVAPFTAPDQTPCSSIVVPPPPDSAQSNDPEVEFEDDVPAPSPQVLAELTAAAHSIPPPPGTAAVEYDDAGLPWDKRIHMDGRQRKLNGEWKNRKRLDQAVLTAVMAELEPRRVLRSAPVANGSATPTVPAGTVAPLAPPPPPALAVAPALSSVAGSAITTSAVVSVPSTVTVPPAPNGAPPPPPPGPVLPVNGALTFRVIMARVSTGLKDGKLSHDTLNAGLISVGLQANQLTALATNAQLLEPMSKYLDAMGVA